MTDRIRLDDLTSDQYDQLCDELERLRADARQCAAQQWPQRLARAEASTDGELRRQLADVIRALGKAETELAQMRAHLDPAGLHARIAAAIRDSPARYHDDIATAVMRVLPADVRRVTALYERWVKAGPPLGQQISRWWDRRLAELGAALRPEEPAAPLTPAEEVRLAMSGIDTPGCDCGHDGMGVSWHRDDCLWRRSVVDCPGRPTPG